MFRVFRFCRNGANPEERGRLSSAKSGTQSYEAFALTLSVVSVYIARQDGRRSAPLLILQAIGVALSYAIAEARYRQEIHRLFRPASTTPGVDLLPSGIKCSASLGTGICGGSNEQA